MQTKRITSSSSFIWAFPSVFAPSRGHMMRSTGDPPGFPGSTKTPGAPSSKRSGGRAAVRLSAPLWQASLSTLILFIPVLRGVVFLSPPLLLRLSLSLFLPPERWSGQARTTQTSGWEKPTSPALMATTCNTKNSPAYPLSLYMWVYIRLLGEVRPRHVQHW